MKAAKRYRRALLTRLAVMFIALAAAAAAGISALNTAFARETGAVYMTITAKSGDTLWSIAAEHNYADRDVRAVVDEIIRENNLDSARISVGDKINVPVG